MSSVKTAGSAGWRRGALWLARGVLVVWAGLWMVFPIAQIDEPGAWPYASRMIAALVGLIAACIMRARLGGALLVAAGAWAMWNLNHEFARAALAAPALVLGAVFFALGGGRRATPGESLGGAAGSGQLPVS